MRISSRNVTEGKAQRTSQQYETGYHKVSPSLFNGRFVDKKLVLDAHICSNIAGFTVLFARETPVDRMLYYTIYWGVTKVMQITIMRRTTLNRLMVIFSLQTYGTY